MRAPALLLAATLLASAPAASADPLAEDLVPDPALTPEQVVRIQLEALRNNDAGDRGIAVAFRFASPGNRQNTGPLPRFKKRHLAALLKQQTGSGKSAQPGADNDRIRDFTGHSVPLSPIRCRVP